jgi:tetratricopeptide (TPR) repeat protein
MMNKFKYGNMEDKSIYMDENNLRMTMNLRNNFARLADALIFENKKDSALKVLERATSIMPKENIPYNFFVLPMADAYYKLGKSDKANEIVKELTNIYAQDLKFYTSLKGKDASSLSYETQQAVAILQRISYVLSLNKQDTLKKEVDAVLAMYQGKVDMSQPMGGEEEVSEE